jgi:uncharacterized protein (DUF362 family)
MTTTPQPTLNSSVSLLGAATYDLAALSQALENLLAPLGGMAAFVKPGDRVLLKPNLLTGSRPGKECVTRPEVVYCVAKLVQAAGGKPFLGDGPAFGSARGVAKNSGYLPLCEALDLPIVEFHGKRYETVSEEFNHLRLSKEAMDADVVINLPKVKSHMQLTMTLGVKNLFGCVPGKMKAWWHMEAGKDENRFAEMLVETARTINPDLTILDGIIGHEGNGPSAGEPRQLGVLAASTNVFALDLAVLQLLQVDTQRVPTMRVAGKMGLVPQRIEFPLATPQDLQIDGWQLPATMMPIDFGAPRVLRSTFKHLYIRLLNEPMEAYAVKRQASS